MTLIKWALLGAVADEPLAVITASSRAVLPWRLQPFSTLSRDVQLGSSQSSGFGHFRTSAELFLSY